MKLRSQMLLAGALTLAVPLVGWQSVKQLYSALQQTRIDEQTLKVANMRLAISEAAPVSHGLSQALQTSGGDDWYAPSSPYPIFVDGYADDWKELVGESLRYETIPSDTAAVSELSVSVRAARIDQSLYLFLSVVDDQLLFHTPPRLVADAGEGELPDLETRLVNGDSVEILIKNQNQQWQHGLFRAIAPGPVQALTASRQYQDDSRIAPAGVTLAAWQGAWVTSNNGYDLELQLPLPPIGSVIGLAVVDVDRGGQPRTSWTGSLSPQLMAQVHQFGAATSDIGGSLLFYDNPDAQAYLQRWTTAGVRARLYDVQGRLLADVNKLYARGESPDEADESAQTTRGLWDAILLRVFAFFVAGDLPLLPETRNAQTSLNLSAQRRATVVDDVPVTSRYVTDENDRVLGTLAPLGTDPRRGYLLFEANEEHASAYAGSQLARLFSLLLLVSLLAGSGLLIFAFVLSSRIRRLSQQAQLAIAADGRVKGLPGIEAKDEIGDLSRKLSSLLSRSAAYTQYLEALASRLSHELRTPLSVVRTSLENLNRDDMDEQSRQLLDRASGGAEHLGSIIKALVESTRLEQSVQLADRETVSVSEWLIGCQARYGQVYPDIDIRIHPDPIPPVSITASPELLQQAFDKLVDNAVSFATSGSVVIYVRLDTTPEPRQLFLGVANRGEPVDAALLEQWFEPLYSARQAVPEGMHLGLGLYIVKMIAHAHGGTVYAENEMTSEQHNWVHVGLRLPYL